MKETKEIITPSLYVFSTEIADYTEAGWKIDIEGNPPILDGFQYKVGFVRELKEGEKPKLTPSERMAVAREARAAKRGVEKN